MVNLQKSSPKLNSLGGGGEIVSDPIGLTWEPDILVLKPSRCLHNGNQIYDWMGLDEWNSWLKSQVRDSNRSQDNLGALHFKYDFWHRTATAGSDVVQSGRQTFDDFFQHLWPYIGNNTTNVVFQMVKRLWLIHIEQ
ncbi:adhesion G protein-coupled receptor B2 [Trichonephila clavipes]|nr:adhesion G protein-coupled receptor B2 [Trichonephila clavipes]